MQRFKVSLLAAAGLLVLAFVLNAIGPKRALAALGFTPVRDVTNPALDPHTEGDGFVIANTVTTDANLSTVPAGKRLVIEQLFANASVPAGQTGFFFIRATANGSIGVFSIPVQQTFADSVVGGTLLTTAQPVRIYADPGTVPEVSFRRSSDSGGASYSFWISGHYVNVP